VIHDGTWPEDPGDEEILARAHSEGRVLVTLDKDFGEIAIVRGRPHSGILRLVGIRARQQGEAILSVLDRFGRDLAAGGIVTAESGRVRIRLPPSNT
jgi:predicted nuclease of predicted toxin-antitoxin system